MPGPAKHRHCEPRCLALYQVVIAELKHFPDLSVFTESGAVPIIAPPSAAPTAA
ncbi:MAG: hypothetical protein IPM80_20570 [Proteobacteria bacterium]|nr:hypothetical protein [Pseudomonadota bacterium]